MTTGEYAVFIISISAALIMGISAGWSLSNHSKQKKADDVSPYKFAEHKFYMDILNTVEMTEKYESMWTARERMWLYMSDQQQKRAKEIYSKEYASLVAKLKEVKSIHEL